MHDSRIEEADESGSVESNEYEPVPDSDNSDNEPVAFVAEHRQKAESELFIAPYTLSPK